MRLTQQTLPRRAFLRAAAMTTAAASLPARLLAAVASPEADLESRLAADPMRPQFHLLPAKNWMNDPNGPIYYNGQYHMFHQYNPLAAVWGDMSWYHSVSPDMLHWTHLPLAFEPTPNSPDSFGCFSGSALQSGERVYQVYTGTKLGTKADATLMGDPLNIQESQCLAYSDDPKLIHWTKIAKPIIPLPPSGLKITGFRDPSAWKQGDWYYMTVGSGESEVGGCVLLYRSKAIETGWEYMHKLTEGAWNGKKTSNPCDDGEMWECPDFFALDGQHVLIYSTLGKVIWQSGLLDTTAMRFHPKMSGELDLGAFYAPKTQLDAKGRRILWGWLQEKRSDDAMKQAGWSGMMGLPRVLNLDADGRLRVTALPEAKTLRAGAVPQEESGSGMLRTLRAACGEVVVTGTPGKPLDLTMSDGATKLLSISYVPDTHTMMVDGKAVSLEAGDAPRVHAFVDGSVIEVLLGERIGYTKRFYYSEAAAPDILVRVDGMSAIGMQAWQMKPISPNRLTTPATSA